MNAVVHTAKLPLPATSPSNVCVHLQRVERPGLTWGVVKVLSEAAVEARLFAHICRWEPAAREAIELISAARLRLLQSSMQS